MNKRIAFRGADHSDIIEQHVNKQLARIEESLEHERSPKVIDIVLEFHPNHAHNRVDLHITTPSYNVVAQREGQDILKVIDEVLDIAYDDIRKAKEKNVDEHKKMSHCRE